MGTYCTCGKFGDHHITTQTGEGMDLCWDCYSDWMCEQRGLDPTRYQHPETVKILGKTFTVHHDVYIDCMKFTAIADTKDRYLVFSCQVPFETDGMEATAKLRDVIREGLQHPSMNKQYGMLEEKGFFDIWYDEEDPNNLSFIIDGKPYSSRELLKLLQQREGWRLAFEFTDTHPQRGTQWFLNEEDLPQEDEW